MRMIERIFPTPNDRDEGESYDEPNPTPSPVSREKVAEADDLHDVVTHRSAWREALEQLKTLTSDDNGTGYWSHEIRAFDRTFDKLEALALAQPGAGVEGWRSPETMPRDGTMFLAGLFVRTNGGGPEWEQSVVWLDDETGEVARSCEFGWDAQDIEQWHPLPAAPQVSS